MSSESSPSAPSRPRPSYGGSRPGGPRSSEDGGPKGPRRWGPPRRKVCRFCVDHADSVDYKNTTLLRNFVTERGKLLSGRSSGNCAKHHRLLTQAVKRARNLALLPYTMV